MIATEVKVNELLTESKTIPTQQCDAFVVYEAPRIVCPFHGDVECSFAMNGSNFCVRCVEQLFLKYCREVEIIPGRRLPTEAEREEERQKLEEEILRRTK